MHIIIKACQCQRRSVVKIIAKIVIIDEKKPLFGIFSLSFHFLFCSSKKMTNFAPAKLKGATHSTTAPVAKLVDALDLGSSNASCVGSSPIRRTSKTKYSADIQWNTFFV